MAKRFTDSEKWKKRWYRLLTNDYKVFWQFILDHCNHAGIWEVDFDFVYMFCGNMNEQEIRKVFLKQYIELDGGKRWFIKDFIEFQYGDLNPNNNLHRSVITILKKAGVFEGLFSPSVGAKDKVKDKDKEKEGVIGETKDKEFEEIWKQYPNKDGKKDALRHFKASVKTEEDFNNIKKALENYKNSNNVKNNFIKNGSTWFNNWKDWISNPKGDTTERKPPDKSCSGCSGSGFIYAPGSGKNNPCYCTKVK